ncbi:MAG: glycine dehydrogenase subunit 2 [Thermococcaceae archaeon]|nr:glycine dehydrogenase subunit 2 [Thermococcaceae archaeon]
MRAYHLDRGETQRNEIIVPDSAHGTNPASAAMAGFKVVEIPSNEQGTVDLEALENAVSERTAGIMLTNPNMGFDIVHINLHKTFSTPHGGGGPGAGPVGVKEHLVDYLPVPLVEFDGEKYYLNYDLCGDSCFKCQLPYTKAKGHERI